MLYIKGNLILEQEDCNNIHNLASNIDLYSAFLSVVKNTDKNINIAKIASIQTPGSEIKLSLELMQCLRKGEIK